MLRSLTSLCQTIVFAVFFMTSLPLYAAEPAGLITKTKQSFSSWNGGALRAGREDEGGKRLDDLH